MRKQLLRGALLATTALLAPALSAQAQNGYTVSLSPAGPLTLPAGGSLSLAATVTSAPFSAGSGFNGFVRAIVPLPDCKLLVGGFFTSYNGVSCPVGLVRLNGDGSLDASFTPGGLNGGPVYTVLRQPDGKLLVGGQFFTSNNAPRGILRLNADGSRDMSFNVGGSGIIGGSVSAIALTASGQIVIGGSFIGYNGQVTGNNLVRLNADGTLDASFNAGGTGANGAGVSSLVVQPGGKLVVGGGFTDYNGNTSVPKGVLRLNADGSWDNTFNPGGAGFNASSSFGTLRSVTVEPGGQLLVAGSFSTYNGLASCPDGLARLSADGALDATFNAGGAGFGIGTNQEVWSVARQPNGQLVVGGAFTSYNNDAASPDNLLRLNADGTRDLSFNAAANAGFDGYINAVAVRADGRLLAGGDVSRYNGATVSADLVSLAPGGAFDNAPLPITTGLSYQWSPNGQTTPTISVLEPGQYSVTVTVGGCAAVSSAVSVTAVTAARPAQRPTLALWPNPTSGTVTLRGARPGAPVQVLDLRGRLLLRTTTDATGQARLTLPAPLPAGVYVVRCGSAAARLVKQ